MYINSHTSSESRIGSAESARDDGIFSSTHFKSSSKEWESRGDDDVDDLIKITYLKTK